MNGMPSSPPPLAQKHEDDKEQIKNIITADAQRHSPSPSPSPSPARSDITDMPSTPPSIPGTQAGAANGATAVTEDAVQNDDEMEIDPSDEIQQFDWEELQARYHQMIKERGDAENKLWDEFKELIDYFTIWTETTQGHEVDRSFKRMKTRIHHVQASEEQFEQKRKHYISVVDAFQSALALLNRP